MPAAAITRAEGPLGIESVTIGNVNAMRTALEAAGAALIEESASRVGVGFDTSRTRG